MKQKKRRYLVYLKHVPTDDLVEVIDLQDVINPYATTVLARGYTDERLQRTDRYPKTELIFPSGEALPQCWTERSFHDRIAI